MYLVVISGWKLFSQGPKKVWPTIEKPSFDFPSIGDKFKLTFVVPIMKFFSGAQSIRKSYDLLPFLRKSFRLFPDAAFNIVGFVGTVGVVGNVG